MKRLFLLLALCGIVAIGCTEGGVDDNIDNGGNNTEQPGKDYDDENIEDKITFITDSKGNVVVEAEGGEVVVTVTTNIKYSVEIPEEAQSWLSVADTRAIRMEELTFTIADNNTFEERSADVELVDSNGKSLQTINFTQLAKSNVIANNEIWYTTTDNNRIILPSTESTVFGAYFISNTYSDGKGVLTFDGEITKIGNGAFKDIGNLASITIPDSVTSIGDYAFNFCDSLTSVYITDIAAWCNISFGDYSSNPLYYAENLYLNNELVTDLIIPDSVTSIGSRAFFSCDSLTSVNIADSVTSIGSYAFDECTSLTSVTIPDSVTSIGDYAFSFCTSLASVNIPDSVTSIGDAAFGGCTSLASVNIPDSVTSIGDYTFCGCISLASVTIPDSVIEIGISAFLSTSLASVNIPDSVTSIGYYAFNECKSLTSITIPDSVTSIGDCAFGGCTSLTSITIPDSVTSIGSGLFSDCTSLTSVTIPDSVTSIGDGAFRNCTSLTSVNIPDSVTSIGYYAFRNCTSLASVTIGNGVTSIGDWAFYGCDSLTSVYITDIAAWCNISFGDYNSNPLYYAENLYLNNELVTDLIIPDGVTSIGNYAFYGCTSLTSVTIPNSVTSIGSGVFRNCTSLKEVYCKPTTPPTGDYSMFGVNASGRTIYVPRNSVGTYKSASGWSSYASAIVGYDF